MRKSVVGLAASAALFAAGAAHASGFPSYPGVGTENPVTYTFTATATGTIVAYFAGFNAGDTEDLGMKINGVDTGFYGLENKTTSVGDSFNFGGATVTAGDVLTFFIRDTDIATNWSSDPAENGGFNAIYSTSYGGGDAGIPLGSYKFVAFEDRGPGGDKDYNDETFVFQNVGAITHGGAPEPMTWALMLMGFGGAGAMLLRRRTAIA